MGTQHNALVRARKSTTIAALCVVTVLFSGAIIATPAAADTSPAPGIPATVSTDSLPTAQINGVAWDQVVIGNTVYVGGSFSSARPAGSAAGTNTVARSNLLAFNLSTGVLLAFAPVVNGQIRAMDASPDGTRLYIAGGFTTVNGAVRNRVAAFDVATGALVGGFAPSVNGEVYAVGATNSTVYIGGQFSAVGTTTRSGRTAAMQASNGAVTPWAPTTGGGRAFALEVSPDGSKVVLAGNFTTLNGAANPGYGMGAVNATTGTNVAWNVGTIIRNGGADAAIYGLSSDNDSVYGTGFVYPFPTTRVTTSNFEGAFRASWTDGSLQWVADCRGDEYSIAAVAGAVYMAGHAHDCSPIGGFPQTQPSFWYRAEALTKAATQVSRGQFFAGQPAPTVLPFYPSFNTGSYTGQFQGPWSVTGNDNYVVYAGEFTTVNGQGQQGLSRFALSAIAPDTDGPRVSAANWPVTTAAAGSGATRIAWPANHDRDNENLTYRLIRDGNTASPIFTTTGRSLFWDRGNFVYIDAGLTPGSSHTYRVTATDPRGNAVQSSVVTAAAGTSGSLGAYATSVLTDNPTNYYRLGEASGGSVNQSGLVANTGATGEVTATVDLTVGVNVTRTGPSAVGGTDGSMGFDGTDASRSYTTERVFGDDSLSVEAWFRTTDPSGKIVGFGNSATATNSTTTDRHIYLVDGKVTWGIFNGTNNIVETGAGFDDGEWHHVVGTVSSAGQSLYVDGVAVGTNASVIKARPAWGYWHIGGDGTWSGDPNFTGDIDEVAVYKTPLTATQVAEHFTLGGGVVGNLSPTASFTTSSVGLAAHVDATASIDADGTITSYGWTFGDGTTATGVSTTHTYAAPGTYSIGLTVTDDDGAHASTTRSVTVTAIAGPVVLATDTFGRTTTGGWGSADTGGAWSAAASANYVVNGGTGALVHASGSTRRALLSAISTSDSDVTVDVSIDKPATGGGVSVGAVGRQVGAEFYQGRVRFIAGGSIGLQLMTGASTVLANATIAGLTYTPGQQLRLRVTTSGVSPTTISAKVWLVGTPEPATWQVTNSTSVPTGLQASGSIGVESYVSGSATNAPLTVRVDNLQVVQP